jgi:beta-alanine degradation protein BauB
MKRKMAEPTMLKAVPVSLVKNNEVRVTEWQFAPSAATGHHRHDFDYVVVPLTDGILRLISTAGEAKSELKSGVAYFRKAGVEHDVINAGNQYLAFVEVELLDHPGQSEGRPQGVLPDPLTAGAQTLKNLSHSDPELDNDRL